MSTSSLSLNSAQTCLTLPSCSNSTKTAVVLIATVVALAAIAALTVGVFANCEIIIGLNSMTQWALIGIGACIATGALVVGVFSFSRIKRENFQSLTLETLESRLQTIITQEKNPVEAVHRLAEVIPLKRLEELVREKYPNFQDALHAANGMAHQAQSYLAIRENLPPSIQTKLLAIRDTLVAILDSIFQAFGISDFFEVQENKFEGDFKFQKIMMLLSLFTLLTATLLPMLGVTMGTSIVGGTLLVIAVMSVLWPRIRPLPTRIQEGENWSKQAREGRLRAPGGRDEEVKKIAQALINKQHPLLLGRSGVGKTETVKAFVQALEAGDFPELRGKTVFYFDTANLVMNKELFGGNKILKRISETIGRHRNDCILVFDEIHMAYQDNKNSAIGAQLKIFLDEKEGNFPYVIGLTTREEYYRDIYKANAAGDRRFEKIDISSTSPEATLAILNQFLIKRAPDALVAPGALEYLVEKTKDQPQPITARKILSSALSKREHLATLPKSKEAGEISARLNEIYSAKAVQGGDSCATDEESAQQLERRLAQLQSELKEEQEKLQQFVRTKNNLANAREAKFRSALGAPQSKKLSELLLLKYFFESALEQEVQAQAKDLDAKVVIDQQLIDDVLKEEEENKQLTEQAVLQGKETLHKRAE
jgi:MoxR-like ATPase